MTNVKNTVAEQVRQLVGAMAPTRPGELTGELRLVEDLGFDSLRLMELTLALERAFDLPRYRPEQLTGVRCVADVVALVEGVRQ
ncbi:acyl carrier protein [Nocardia sp. NPDC052254]|uniref:acyl carrier protein n=1 Tax=Nocardia sp. NPDC052254 TaxID=3155681 RepID=UPI003432A259